MSALASAVVARYANQTLVDLTRRKGTASSTYDSTLLELACTDATADLAIYAGVVLDTTNALHLATACFGVISYLKSWSRESPDAAEADLKRWIERCTALGKVTSRDRVAVQTTVPLTPTDPTDGGSIEIRPAMDDDAFDGYIPGRP